MRNNDNTKKLTRAAMLAAFALVLIFTGSRIGGAVFNQIVVGPLVNAVIMVTVLICDIKYGILISILTPVIAAVTGQLASPMVPFVPFIMLGNITLAVVFGLLQKYVKKYGIYLGIAAGSVLKTLVLTFSVKYLVALFKLGLKKPIVDKLSVMMAYPQLYSALAGGVVALAFYALYKRAYEGKY
jgi:hypothetical protein